MARTLDLTPRTFGCDYAFKTEDRGLTGQVSGWSTPRPSNGDYLILKSGEGTTRYRVVSVHHYLDPGDMFSATVEFAPR